MHGFIGVRFHPTAPPPQCIGDAFNAFWHGGLNAFLLPSAALDYSEIIGHEIGHAIIHWGSGPHLQVATGRPERGHCRRGRRDVPSLAGEMAARYCRRMSRRGSGNSAIPRCDARHERILQASWIPQIGKPYPDHFDDYRHISVDNAGVHINSSIMNQGYYLLAMGGPAPSSAFRARGAGRGVGEGTANIRARGLRSAHAERRFRGSAVRVRGCGRNPVRRILAGVVATHTAMDAIGYRATGIRLSLSRNLRKSRNRRPSPHRNRSLNRHQDLRPRRSRYRHRNRKKTLLRSQSPRRNLPCRNAVSHSARLSK